LIEFERLEDDGPPLDFPLKLVLDLFLSMTFPEVITCCYC